ncbi:MAG: hypothetical protein AVDCRST_MAG42-113, partial [uncultured Chthoniobacterales bacterium]
WITSSRRNSSRSSASTSTSSCARTIAGSFCASPRKLTAGGTRSSSRAQASMSLPPRSGRCSHPLPSTLPR